MSAKLLRHLVKTWPSLKHGSNSDLEPELEGPVRLQVAAGPCNHRNRAGNLRTRGPEIGASYPAEPIEKALRNLPADVEGFIYPPAWRQSTDRLRPSSTALRALCEDTSAVANEWNVPVRIVGEVRRSRTGRQGHKSPKW